MLETECFYFFLQPKKFFRNKKNARAREEKKEAPATHSDLFPSLSLSPFFFFSFFTLLPVGLDGRKSSSRSSRPDERLVRRLGLVMASSSVAVDGTGEKRSSGKCLYYLRNIATFLVSHIGLVSLVVGYCIMGAFTFEALEAKHELQVKREMIKVRESVTDDLWRFTYKMDVLVQEEWTTNVTDRLKKFETHLIESMKKKGWDGSEETDKVQWTLAGALFYSIILITTIGMMRIRYYP